jgi:hypothetical protein
LNPDPNINPYSPPATDVVPSCFDDEYPMKRPTSVKWAIAMVFLLLMGACATYAMNVANWGWQESLDSFSHDPLAMVDVVVRLLGLITVFTGRSIRGFQFGVMVLGWGCLMSSQNVWLKVLTEGRIISPASFEGVLSLLLLGLIYWLFIRFTFGLPSRLYFRVAKP